MSPWAVAAPPPHGEPPPPTHAPVPAEHPSTASPPDRRAVRDQVLGADAPARGAAGLHQRGVRLALEPVHPPRQDITFLNAAADTVDVVRAIDDPAVGCVFDTWHLWWEWGIEAIARSIAPSCSTCR